MDTLYLILYIIAALCFAVAAFGVQPVGDATRSNVVSRINLVALGLLAWVLVPLIMHIDTM